MNIPVFDSANSSYESLKSLDIVFANLNADPQEANSKIPELTAQNSKEGNDDMQ